MSEAARIEAFNRTKSLLIPRLSELTHAIEAGIDEELTAEELAKRVIYEVAHYAAENAAEESA